MDEAAFANFHSFLNEVEDGVNGVVFFVEDLDGEKNTFCSFSVQLTER